MIYELLIFLLVGLLFYLMVALIVAVQAQRRGYALFAWVVAGLLGNSIFLLVVLGVLPDFARRRMREQEMEDLQRRLRERARVLPAESDDFRAKAEVSRSPGDQSTALPDRSLGDEETRL